VTTRPQPRRSAQPMIEPFPIPGTYVQLAYRELNLAVNGTDEEREQIGNPALLPRPWEPASCLDPELRHQLWQWLEEVVVWLNREYSWDVSGMIPTCWPDHPHLVHEITVVADQRRRAGLATTSDALEEWHRYCLPPFLERMRARLKSHCDDEHVRWPGRSRHNEHTSERDVEDREDIYAADVDALPASRRRGPEPAPTKRFAVVDRDTGEIRDEYDRTSE
jgi:hypothetical protein